MVILDTDIIIEFLKGNESAIQKIKELKNLEIAIETTSINTFELFEGVFRKGDESSLISVTSFLSNLSKVAPFDIISSRIAGRIMSNLKQKGAVLDQADVMTAAIAVKEGKAVVTRNKKHFERIDGLKLDTW